MSAQIGLKVRRQAAEWLIFMTPNTFFLTGSEKEFLTRGLKIFLQAHKFTLIETAQDAEFQIECRKVDEKLLKIEKKNNKGVISYSQDAYFFRGISLFIQHREKSHFILEETPNFASNGIMLDCSRNCVPKIETIKKTLVRLAEFGMNRMYLYIEDTLEIEGYPYWGYLRGRFKKGEIKECDKYARCFGITLVPCVQTLAHLRNALKQPMFDEYKDIDDILLLESEKTRKLLRALLKTITECFSGNIIHLGMDEAANLGRGKYLDTYGYHDPAEIMKRHLEWLTETCRQLGLHPMIWSDMYLKFNFKVDDYYGLSENKLPQNKGSLSDRITLCYWDYYNEGVCFYDKYIRLHQKLGNPVAFAGGAWTWNGIAPGMSKALTASRDALAACCKNRVDDVFCTIWMDNGAETPLLTMLPILSLYGEFGFSTDPDMNKLKERFAFCFGKKWEDYFLLDAFDNPEYENGGHNRYCENPSKTILYEDNLMGMFIKMFDENKMKSRYEHLVKKLESALNKPGKMDEEDYHLFSYYKILAMVLCRKAGITERIREAYFSKNNERLRLIAETELPEIAYWAEQLRNQRQVIWMKEYKPFGFEILDIRLAGVSARAKSAASRIADLVTGKIDHMPEAEEEILPYKTEKMLDRELLHGYYIWDKLISAGSIEGV